MHIIRVYNMHMHKCVGVCGAHVRMYAEYVCAACMTVNVHTINIRTMYVCTYVHAST